jgi:hypothetical protein
MAFGDWIPDLGGLVVGGLLGTDNGTTGRRGYSAGWFALEMDNQPIPVGFVTSVDGGHFRSNPVHNPSGDTQFTPKYSGKPTYEDITIGIGMPNSWRLFNWVKSSIENRPERHTGAIVGYDNFAGQQERSRRVFTDALIQEVRFPALDAASTQPANITLKICPETLVYQPGLTRLNPGLARDEVIKQKQWSCANFGMRLDGFWGQGSQRNAKIEPFTLRQSIMENHSGDRLEPTKWAGRVEYPHITITFDEGYVNYWYKWYRDSSINGRVLRRTGAISWYAPNMRSELMRLEMDGVGLLNLEIERWDAHKDGMARGKATLFVEKMNLVPGLGNV